MSDEARILTQIQNYLAENGHKAEVLVEGRFRIPFSQYRVLGTPLGLIYEAGVLTEGGDVEWTPLFVFGATSEGFELSEYPLAEDN